jgi:hypothetical protein
MQVQQPTKQLKSGKRRTSVVRVCLCWLLCLSVWRGPIPVVHGHALDLISLANNSHLAEHALKYHADSLMHEQAGNKSANDEDSGLHIHFILLDPWSDSLLADHNHQDCSNHQAGAADSLLRIEQQSRADLDFNLAQSRMVHVDLPLVAEDLRFSSTADTGYLQTQFYRTPALAVLCVCLC